MLNNVAGSVQVETQGNHIWAAQRISQEEGRWDRGRVGPYPGSRLQMSQISMFLAQSGPMRWSVVARSTMAPTMVSAEQLCLGGLGSEASSRQTELGTTTTTTAPDWPLSFPRLSLFSFREFSGGWKRKEGDQTGHQWRCRASDVLPTLA
jgi:hypothetical protein